ncbi:MAG: ABC transporter permease [Flavobacteriaceae bacterium]|nr:ABC transporter permease [Flavobacteriaceae bacterium]
MNHLSLVIKREYLTKIKNKSFIIMTILSPMIMIALIALVAYLTQLNNNKHRTISILDESGLVTNVFENTENTTYVYLSNIALETAKQTVESKEEYGLLHIANGKDIDAVSNQITFYSKDAPSITLIKSLESRLEREFKDEKLKEQGVDITKIKATEADVDISQESFLGERTSKIGNVMKLIFGGAAGYLLFMFIIIYGNMIMRSVIEEKTSRIIEIIISSVKPVQLMLGKIIGTSLAGITQFLIWMVIGGILLTVITVVFNIDMMQMQTPQQELMQQTMENLEMNDKIQVIFNEFRSLPIINLIIAFVLFFIGGYLLYSSLYAAIGAAVDNETDTQQFMMPILMPLILAVYVGVFTVIEDPHGTVSTVFSFIPLTSPVVMLMRIPFGVPLWQQGISIALLIGTFMLTVWFAAKIYRVGILMYGKKPSYKEIIKWLKY